MRKLLTRSITFIALLTGITLLGYTEAKPKKNPYIDDSTGVRKLILPEAVDEFLDVEFPKYRIPDEKDFNPEMLDYYNSRLIGIHPAVAWGDFNGDRKQDYALLVVTSEGKWGPSVELVVLNGDSSKDKFVPFRLGEIYNFKDDYVSFSDGKLMKGRYKKSAWFINWDKKDNKYIVNKA